MESSKLMHRLHNTRSKIPLCRSKRKCRFVEHLKKKKVGGQQLISWVRAESGFLEFMIPSISSISRMLLVMSSRLGAC